MNTKEATPPNKGLALHVHHDTLVEHCYDYKDLCFSQSNDTMA